MLALCGGWIRAQNGTVTSPNYPAGSESGMQCEWIIEVPRGHYIEFTFIDLNLDSSVNGQCSSDSFVEIRDYNETGLCFSSVLT